MVHGMNDPEAGRCLQKAQASFQKGDFATAERLARKAYRMFSEKNTSGKFAAENLLDQIEQKDTSNGCASGRASPGSAPASSSDISGLRQRKATTHSDSNQADTVDYNPEQEAQCRAILRAKDYYSILGIDKTCTSEEVKKAYRKLALQFHPDKAKCPSAEAAFKELSKAYQCLSDPDARKHYDMYGTEDDTRQQQQYRQHYESHFMTPEELFESFFGAHFARGPFTQHRVYRTRGHSSGAGNGGVDPRRSAGFLQFLPLLALLLITLLSSLFNSPSTPPFSFSKTPEYSVGRLTLEHQLPYFVKPSFSRTYSNQSDRIKELEIQIELSHFSNECSREQQRLAQQLSALKFYGTAEQYRRKSEELRQKEESSVNCRNFKKLKVKYPRHAQQFYRQSNSVWF